jgi:hypothetical protein
MKFGEERNILNMSHSIWPLYVLMPFLGLLLLFLFLRSFFAASGFPIHFFPCQYFWSPIEEKGELGQNEGKIRKKGWKKSNLWGRRERRGNCVLD